MDRSAQSVLEALHEVDALRLGPDGQIVLAYPFSTQPTRHRVTIGHQVTAYAMCAIDALGHIGDLHREVAIESYDVSTGERISVLVQVGQAPGLA